MFGRGYSEVKEKAKNKSRYVMSCNNCDYLYDDKNGEEVCNNPDVLSFDIIVDDDGRVYCHHWKTVSKKRG